MAPSTHTARSVDSRLRDTQDAFDSVAADYDGPRGNNALIQDMRGEIWRWLDATLAPASKVLDLGCGTGLDAVRLAQHGHHVTATDFSSAMIERTRTRAQRASLGDRIRTIPVGAHELHRIEGQELFDLAYSNMGALNCVPDPTVVATESARLLRRGGTLMLAVIGRVCPWEIGYYALKGGWRRLSMRFAAEVVPVGMNRRIIWTRYYSPLELYRHFERHFELQHYRGLCVFAPPPYLTGVRSRHPRLYDRLWRMDRIAAGWPLLRAMGDHFLIVMRKRDAAAGKDP